MTMYVRHVNMIGHENTGSHLWKFVTWRFVYRGLTVHYSVFISVPPSDWIFYFLNGCNRFVLFSVYQGTRKPNIKETVDGLIHTRTYILPGLSQNWLFEGNINVNYHSYCRFLDLLVLCFSLSLIVLKMV